MLALMPFIVAQQIAGSAQSGREFSQSTMRHAMASPHGPIEVVLVVAGVIVVVATTAYAVRCLVRPRETAADHIKRRILDDGGEGSR
jgi:hypothetical protein